jgi:hypothetical protein
MTLPSRHLDTGNGVGAEKCEENSSEIRTGELLDSLERFQQSRAVIEDFSSRTLAAISTDFGRLGYVSSLKDSATGRYEHDGLMSLYSEGSVQAALAHCHEELFSRILEMPLREQERDLRGCLDTFGDRFSEVVQDWREQRNFMSFCPEGSPDYLHDLFCSNMGALLSILSSQRAN